MNKHTFEIMPLSPTVLHPSAEGSVLEYGAHQGRGEGSEGETQVLREDKSQLHGLHGSTGNLLHSFLPGPGSPHSIP